MNYFFMILTVIIFATQLITYMLFDRKYRDNNLCYFVFSMLYFIVTTIILIVANGGIGETNLVTVLFGIAFGTVFVFTMLFNITAMSVGPIGFTSLIFSLSLLLPMLLGLVVYNETISLIQIAGLLLLFVTFYLGSTASKDEGSKKMTLKWLMFALLAFLGGGLIGSLNKIHQSLYPGKYMTSYLVIGFIAATIVAGGLALYRRLKHKEEIKPMIHKNVIWLILIAGLTTAFGNYLIVMLVSRVPSVILFPVTNGGQVIFMTIASILIFKEKLTVRAIISILIGATAICLISL